MYPTKAGNNVKPLQLSRWTRFKRFLASLPALWFGDTPPYCDCGGRIKVTRRTWRGHYHTCNRCGAEWYDTDS